MKFKKMARVILAAALSSVMIFAAGCGSSATTSSAESAEDESYEDIEDEDLLDDEEDVYSPYDNEFQDYLDANAVDILLENHEHIQVSDTTWTLTGGTDSGVTTYLSEDLKAFEYDDGYTEIARESTYDGYDPESDAAFRVIFGDEELRDEQMENFKTIIDTLYGEGIEEMEEDGDNVVFTSYVRSAEAIMISYDDGETDIEDGALVTRVTTFDKGTKELQNMEVTYTAPDADPVTIERLVMTADGDDYSPDADLLAKLDSSDSHTATITLNPGEEDEVVLTATVGKGCIFYPVIDYSYIYYKDEACTEEADDTVFEEENEDIVVYGKYDEGEGDDEELLDEAFLDEDGEISLDEDDLSSLELDIDEGDEDESGEEIFG